MTLSNPIVYAYTSLYWRYQTIKKILSLFIAFVCLGLALYFLTYWEVNRRAGAEWARGEKYLLYYQHPDERKKYLDGLMARHEITAEQYGWMASRDGLIADDGLKGTLVCCEAILESYDRDGSPWSRKALERILNVSGIFYEKKNYILAKEGYAVFFRWINDHKNIPRTLGDLNVYRKNLENCEAKTLLKADRH